MSCGPLPHRFPIWLGLNSDQTNKFYHFLSTRGKHPSESVRFCFFIFEITAATAAQKKNP